jgi:hypothetical protein
MVNRPLHSRISTPLFILLCLVVSIFSGALAFLISAVGVAIFDTAANRQMGNYESAVVVLATLLGFIIPSIVLTRKRRAAGLQIRTANAQSLSRDAISNEASIAPTIERQAGAASPNWAVSEPPTEPGSRFHREIDAPTPPPLVSKATPQLAQAGPSPQKEKPRRTIQRLGIAAATLAIIVVAIAYLSNTGDLGLELRAAGGMVAITNLRNDPAIKIIDLRVNNRDECSTDGSAALCRQMPGATSPAFVAACSRLLSQIKNSCTKSGPMAALTFLGMRFPMRRLP